MKLAELHKQMVNYKAQLEDYTKIIKLHPDRSEVYFLRGLTKCHLAKYRSAIEDFQKIIQLNPAHQDAMEQKALAEGNLPLTPLRRIPW